MPNKHEYIPDRILEQLYNEGGLNPRFYKTVKIRREYPTLSKQIGPRPALEALAKKYFISVETVKIYMWGDRPFSQRRRA